MTAHLCLVQGCIKPAAALSDFCPQHMGGPCQECARLRAAIDTAANILNDSFRGTKPDLTRACGEARRVLRAVVPHEKGQSEDAT